MRHNVVFRQIRKATRKIYRLESDISRVCQRLTSSAKAVTPRCVAVVESTREDANSVQEWLSADIEAVKLYLVVPIESADASFGNWSSRTNAKSLWCGCSTRTVSEIYGQVDVCPLAILCSTCCECLSFVTLARTIHANLLSVSTCSSPFLASVSICFIAVYDFCDNDGSGVPRSA